MVVYYKPKQWRRKVETTVIADTHLDHSDHLLYCGQAWCFSNSRYNPAAPFDFRKNNPLVVTKESLENYGQLIVDNWNAIVGKKDRVIIVGDFAFANHAKWASRLRGQKIMILGHHDEMSKKALEDCHFAEVHEFGTIKSICTGKLYPDGRSIKETVTFCHYPMRSWADSCIGSPQIYAHDHGRMPELDNLLSFTCSTNVWGFIPIPWAAIQKRIDAKRDLIQMKNGRCENGEGAPRGKYSSDPNKRIEEIRCKNVAVLKSIGIDIPNDPTHPVNKPAIEKKEEKQGDGMVSAVIAMANTPNAAGIVYSREALRRIADGKTFIWVENSGKLIVRTSPDILTNKDKFNEMLTLYKKRVSTRWEGPLFTVPLKHKAKN
jgi:calcineurin-like phosphoesterase family protein